MEPDDLDRTLKENRELLQQVVSHLQLNYAAVSALLSVLAERDSTLQRRFQAKFQEIIAQHTGRPNQVVLEYLAEALRKAGKTN